VFADVDVILKIQKLETFSNEFVCFVRVTTDPPDRVGILPFVLGGNSFHRVVSWSVRKHKRALVCDLGNRGAASVGHP
jgi:hypothetical protein